MSANIYEGGTVSLGKDDEAEASFDAIYNYAEKEDLDNILSKDMAPYTKFQKIRNTYYTHQTIRDYIASTEFTGTVRASRNKNPNKKTHEFMITLDTYTTQKLYDIKNEYGKDAFLEELQKHKKAILETVKVSKEGFQNLAYVEAHTDTDHIHFHIERGDNPIDGENKAFMPSKYIKLSNNSVRSEFISRLSENQKEMGCDVVYQINFPFEKKKDSSSYAQAETKQSIDDILSDETEDANAEDLIQSIFEPEPQKEEEEEEEEEEEKVVVDEDEFPESNKFLDKCLQQERNEIVYKLELLRQIDKAKKTNVKNGKLKDENLNLKENIEHANTIIKEKDENLQKLDIEYNELADQNSELENKNIELHSELHETKLSLKATHEELNRYDEENTKLIEENEEYAKEVEKLNQTITTKDEQIKTRDTQIENLTVKTNELETDIESKKEFLETQVKQIETLEAKNSKLEEKLDNKDAKLEKLENAVEAKNEKIEELHEKNEKLNEIKNKAQEETHRLESRAVKAEGEKDRFEQELQNVNDENEDLKEQLKTLQAQLEAYEKSQKDDQKEEDQGPQ